MKNTNTVMGTMEHRINVFGPQKHYDKHSSNDILLNNLNPVASALLSAWTPMSKGVYRLYSPEIPSRRRSADELPVLQSTNKPKLILTYTYKRTQAGNPGIENN